MNTNVLLAVFRRNFVSYFANPTGYVFICVFVFFGAIAAFWVPEFFGNNLANLDQLSFWFPFIMLVFIPTITMGIWADERKQGTDELLLTIPGRRFRHRAGQVPGGRGHLQRLAAVLAGLQLPGAEQSGQHATPGSPCCRRLDVGLFLGTYVGYWLVGAGDAGHRRGRLVPHQQPHDRLRPGRAVQHAAGVPGLGRRDLRRRRPAGRAGRSSSGASASSSPTSAAAC